MTYFFSGDVWSIFPWESSKANTMNVPSTAIALGLSSS
jgi:hypothetical protein